MLLVVLMSFWTPTTHELNFLNCRCFESIQYFFNLILVYRKQQNTGVQFYHTKKLMSFLFLKWKTNGKVVGFLRKGIWRKKYSFVVSCIHIYFSIMLPKTTSQYNIIRRCEREKNAFIFRWHSLNTLLVWSFFSLPGTKNFSNNENTYIKEEKNIE